jgi:hypothetical protein
VCKLINLSNQQLQHWSNDMATRKPSKPKTSAELKQQLEDARIKLADLERRAYAEELSELIAKTNIAADFKAVRSQLNAQISTGAIIVAIANAVGVKGVSVTAPAKKPRAPADPSKPKKPRNPKAV